MSQQSQSSPVTSVASFEKILLKSLTHNGEFFGKVMPIMKKKYFKDIGSQELFVLIKDYHSQYTKIPVLTELVAMVRNVPNATVREEIINVLKEISPIKEIDNVEFLCNETVKFIKDALYLEALMIGSSALQSKNEEDQLKAQEILEERSKITIDSDLGLDFDDIDEMIEYYSERLVGIRTQHKELNKRIGPGFLPKTLSIILAAQGIGKSLLKTDLISGMIKNKNILLVSLEMADKEIMKRVHANALDLPINSLIDLSKTQGELDKIQKGTDNEPGRRTLSKEDIIAAYNKMKLDGNNGKLFVKDYPAGSFSSLMLEQLIDSYKIEKNVTIDIVFVDYLGIMKSDRVSPGVGLYSYIKSIGEELRSVAQKKNIPIISASQLNRCLEKSTIIQTMDGEKQIQHINVGDKVKSNDGYNTVEAVVKTAKQPMYRITLKSGKTIMCSANHLFPTHKGDQCISIGLRVGDKIKTNE